MMSDAEFAEAFTDVRRLIGLDDWEPLAGHADE